MTTSPARPFQFSLGSLLWLVVLVALVCGWLVDRTRLSRAHQEQLQEAQRIRQQAAQQKARSDAMHRRWLQTESELKRLEVKYREPEEAERNLSRTQYRIQRERESALFLENR